MTLRHHGHSARQHLRIVRITATVARAPAIPVTSPLWHRRFQRPTRSQQPKRPGLRRPADTEARRATLPWPEPRTQHCKGLGSAGEAPASRCRGATESDRAAAFKLDRAAAFPWSSRGGAAARDVPSARPLLEGCCRPGAGRSAPRRSAPRTGMCNCSDPGVSARGAEITLPMIAARCAGATGARAERTQAKLRGHVSCCQQAQLAENTLTSSTTLTSSNILTSPTR